VLRGSGSGQNGTIINMTGVPHTCITVNGDKVVRTVGRSTTISSTYIPSGAQVFDLTDASGFAAGDTLRISRPVTAAWVTFMGMDQLVRDGKKHRNHRHSPHRQLRRGIHGALRHYRTKDHHFG